MLEQPPELQVSLLICFLGKHTLGGRKKEQSTDSKSRTIKSHKLAVQKILRGDVFLVEYNTGNNFLSCGGNPETRQEPAN